MNQRWPTLALSFCLILSLLAACGPLELYLEPGAAASSAAPTSTTAPPIPSATSTLTPTPTFEPSPTPIVALTGLLQGGLSLSIVQTRMLSAQAGWGVARVDTDLYDHLMMTADGGQTWKDRTPLGAFTGAPAGGLVVTAHFASSQLAWAAYTGLAEPTLPGSPVIWRTIDGGQSWAASQPLDLGDPAPPVYQPVELGFRDGRNGWLMARLSGPASGRDEVAVFLTTDGGYQWDKVVTPQNQPILMDCRKTGLAFPIQTAGWLVGDCPGRSSGPFFYHSEDNGRSWQPVTLPHPTGQPDDFLALPASQCGIPGFVYVSTRSLIFPVRCQNTAGFPIAWLYASSDGGQTWASRPLPTAYGFFSFTNPDEGWCLGSDDPAFAQGAFLYQTTDGGRSWHTVTPAGWSGPVNFADAENGWVIARIGDREALVRTQNGGQSWQQLKPLSIGE